MTIATQARAFSEARAVGMLAALCAVAPAILAGSTPPVHASVSTTRVHHYGNPSLAAPYWRLQHASDCGELAVADVVGQITGDEPDEQQITAVAERTPSTAGPGPIWRRPATTDIRDLPVLLAHYGIAADNIQTDLPALEQDLAAERRVIVLLNAETIWNRPGRRDVANHFVVLTGIDAGTDVVHLNDSGIVSGRDEQIPMSTFERAWAPNHNSAVVTR